MSKPPPEMFDYRHFGARFVGLGLVALASFAVLMPIALADPEQFAFSYLFAYLFFFTICAGCLFWQLVHHATGARWSEPLIRQLENLSSLLGVTAILFLPLVFVAPHLWKWLAIPPGSDALLDAKRDWLSPGFFWARNALYLAFFAGVSARLRRLSIQRDVGDDRAADRQRRLAFAALPVFALLFTFSAFDWSMGLNHHWYSSLWGVWAFAGAVLASLAAWVLVLSGLRDAGHLREEITPEHDHLLGKLLFAFTIFWAYISYSQYMLIWYAAIPEETAHFAVRSTGTWKALSIALIAGHFFVPFLLLLPAAAKRNASFLRTVAGWILLMHLLDVGLAVLPVLHPEGVSPCLADALCLCAIGCTLSVVFLKRLGDSALRPVLLNS